MVIAAFKTLTWGTVATAVISALLLAWAGGNFPRIASITGDAARGRLSAPNRAEAPGPRAAPAAEAAHGTGAAREGSAR